MHVHLESKYSLFQNFLTLFWTNVRGDLKAPTFKLEIRPGLDISCRTTVAFRHSKNLVRR